MSSLPISFLAIIGAQLLALVFLFAGLAKLVTRGNFTKSVEAYNLLPRRIDKFVGKSLPWLELAVAILLGIGLCVEAGACIALALLFIFSLAQTTVLLKGQEVACGCFGSSSSHPITDSRAARLSFVSC
jgi:putative oxidoreductase